VEVDGQQVFSKKAANRHAVPGEVVEKISNMIGTRPVGGPGPSEGVHGRL
jgi:hypothetical protein